MKEKVLFVRVKLFMVREPRRLDEAEESLGPIHMTGTT